MTNWSKSWPVYDHAEPNNPIFLANEPVSVHLNDQLVIECNAEIWYNFLPTPRLLAVVANQLPQVETLTATDPATLYFPNRSLSVPSRLLRLSGGIVTYLLQNNLSYSKGNEDCWTRDVYFSVCNFLDFYGAKRDVIEQDTQPTAVEYWTHSTDKFELRMQKRIHDQAFFERLKKEGGYGISGFGHIRSVSSDGVQLKDMHEYLGKLQNFLSWSKGSWCSWILPCGLDAQSEKVWESWAVTDIDSYSYTKSWFDPHSASILGEVFDGFLSLCRKKPWKKVIPQAVYWYCGSNPSRRSEFRIVLAHAALDLLSFTYCVTYKNLMTNDAYKKIPAKDKFTMLLASLNIPLSIPDNLQALSKTARERNWGTGCQAICEIRNEIVHPEDKKKGKLYDVYGETSELILWYLDLVLLALCGRNGKYCNRLTAKWFGETESVPWTAEN